MSTLWSFRSQSICSGYYTFLDCHPTLLHLRKPYGLSRLSPCSQAWPLFLESPPCLFIPLLQQCTLGVERMNFTGAELLGVISCLYHLLSHVILNKFIYLWCLGFSDIIKWKHCSIYFIGMLGRLKKIIIVKYLIHCSVSINVFIILIRFTISSSSSPFKKLRYVLLYAIQCSYPT